MPSYQEILSQIEDLKRKAEDVRQQEMSGAIAEIKRLMIQFGITAEDLGLSGRASVGQIEEPWRCRCEISRSDQRKNLDWSWPSTELGA
jgi:hypothetical protein